mgnify:CR=1 FL=1
MLPSPAHRKLAFPDARLEISTWYKDHDTSRNPRRVYYYYFDEYLYDWDRANRNNGGPPLKLSKYRNDLVGVWHYMAVNVMNYEDVPEHIKANKEFWLDVIKGENWKRYFGHIKTEELRWPPEPLPHLVLVPGFPQDDEYLAAADGGFTTMIRTYLSNYPIGDMLYVADAFFLHDYQIHPLLKVFAATNARFLRRLSEAFGAQQDCPDDNIMPRKLAVMLIDALTSLPQDQSIVARIGGALSDTSIVAWLMRYAKYKEALKVKQYVDASATFDNDDFVLNIAQQRAKDTIDWGDDWDDYHDFVVSQFTLIDKPITSYKGFKSAHLTSLLIEHYKTGIEAYIDTDPEYAWGVFADVEKANPKAMPYIRQWLETSGVRRLVGIIYDRAIQPGPSYRPGGGGAHDGGRADTHRRALRSGHKY